MSEEHINLIEKFIKKFGRPSDYPQKKGLSQYLYMDPKLVVGLSKTIPRGVYMGEGVEEFIIPIIPAQIKTRKDFFIIFRGDRAYDGRLFLDIVKIFKPTQYGFTRVGLQRALVLISSDGLCVGIAPKDPNVHVFEEGEMVKTSGFIMNDDEIFKEQNSRFYYNGEHLLLKKEEIEVEDEVLEP